MLAALAKGKIGTVNGRDVFEVEDVLTSVAFGACEQAGLEVLKAFLARAERYDEGAALSSLVAEAFDVTYEFWPRWGAPDGPDSEPELILKFERPEGAAWLLVEAKLHSGKSSAASGAEQATDQLAKYWLQLRSRAEEARAAPLGVLYVTAHLTCPTEELDETQRELAQKRKLTAPLFWLSWRAFNGVAAPFAKTASGVRQVCDLLRERWRLTEPQLRPWAVQVPQRPAWRFTPSWAWRAQVTPSTWRFDGRPQ